MKETNNALNYHLENKVICVTGANGFIGKKLVSELSKIKCQIKILTRKENLSFNKKIEVFIGDLIDPNISLLGFLKNCDILYHCAGEINDENKMSLLHVNGTQKLLDSISNNSEKKNTLDTIKLLWGLWPTK